MTDRTMTWAEAPTLVAGAASAVWLTADGVIEEIDREEAGRRWKRGAMPLLCHAVATGGRTGIRHLPAFDILEVLAFVRPGSFVVPTPFGVTRALGGGLPRDMAHQALALRTCATLLLNELAAFDRAQKDEATAIAAAMIGSAWPWAGDVAAALGLAPDAKGSLDVWSTLREWSDREPRPPPLTHFIGQDDVASRLVSLLGVDAEDRPEQVRYAQSLIPGFAPRREPGAVGAVLAEAGTGVGKTLGYIAPASLWAERNRGTVWISTYTRNLQRQINQELDRLMPEGEARRRRVVVRKGRENYVCLLNFADAVNRRGGSLADTVRLGLIGRWIQSTPDGDMQGGSLPGWLLELLGYRQTMDLADRRGECIYSACDHFRKCFIEGSVRRAHHADIVVSNHALSLLQAWHSGEGDPHAPTRYIFDEGHHLFDAADRVFAIELTCREAEDLRRWLLGAGSRQSRARGLMQRVRDLIGDEGRALIADIARAATALPAPGWLDRFTAGAPAGKAETFFFLVRRQVLDRTGDAQGSYSLECLADGPPEPLLAAAIALHEALGALERPLSDLIGHLGEELIRQKDRLEEHTQQRMEATMRGIRLRGVDVVAEWRHMLETLGAETPAEYHDCLSINRIDGREFDTGMHRHWIDPGLPFAENVAKKAHGIVITSATLRDARDHQQTGDGSWLTARLRTGLRHLADPPACSAISSPFAYPELTRVIVVTDVPRQDEVRVSIAFRDLFMASGGGGLGIFTAIRRLRRVHQRIALPLQQAGLPLYAQHVDAMDTGTLVDIFRAEEDSCLLGTDAVRDGVDVPGRSLRIIVFDRVPWPRPDLLHKARHAAFGDLQWNDLITRLRLRQAFGRLVRRMDDRGVFVLLDPRLPSRMVSAFPEGVEVARLKLDQAIDCVSEHVRENA
ncbi:MAG: ATP-dependent DNA helicase [bacterium]|nr:ATP-dependent DNA helicase [bacterium]